MVDIRQVIVTPGRVAYTTPRATKQFTSTPQTVIWNGYYNELLKNGDIQVIETKVVSKPEKSVEEVHAAPQQEIDPKTGQPYGHL